MKTTHKLKLNKFKERLASKQRVRHEVAMHSLLRRQTKSVTEAFDKLAGAIDEIKEFADREVTIQNVVNVEGLDKIPEAIKNLPTPIFKPSIAVKAPAVNVSLTDQDIYSRYKRANSAEHDSMTYHGFIDAEGNWFIQLESGTDTQARSRYAVGNGDFLNQWARRTGLDYKLLSEVTIK